jgi:hypothetical protein
MIQLKKLSFKELPNAAHFNFVSRVNLLILASSSVLTAALGALVAIFNTWLTEETALMSWVKKSVLTKQIEEANRRMDRALTALRVQVRAQTFSLTQNIAAAANRVYTMLMGYGNVNAKSYEYQDGDVRSILQQLTGSGEYVTDASTLGLSASINELQASFSIFEQLLKQRDDKSLKKPEKTFREVRKGIEGVYRQIETIINANAVVNASPVFATFINNLNPEIERLNREYHRVRLDIGESEPEPIQPQIYTGKPLTPTPKVLYVTPHDGTVQLELGKDFDITFDHNVEVGNAECTVHGKGAYKGRKTVTFVIVHAM